jgi:signal transduction histidine kinase
MKGDSASTASVGALNLAAYLTILGVFIAALVSSWGQVSALHLASIVALFGLFFLLQFLLLDNPRLADTFLTPPRWRWYFIAQGIVAAAIALVVPVGMGYVPILFIILAAQLFFGLQTREAVLWTLGYAALVGILLLITAPLFSAVMTMFIYGGAFIFFAAVTTMFKREQVTRARSEQLLKELEAVHAQLREYAARVEQLAVAEERNRLAREIHDSLGHHLTILSVQLQAASRLIALDSTRAASEIEKARAIVAEALGDVRQSVSALRAQAAVNGQPALALERMIQEFGDATGIIVNYRADALGALSPAQVLTIYRAVQEGLTNVQKHAHASRVDVTLQRDETIIRLALADNGSGDGAARAESGFGLLGLRERVEFLGGVLSYGARAGGGFELKMELPLAGEVKQESAECC